LIVARSRSELARGRNCWVCQWVVRRAPDGRVTPREALLSVTSP